AAARREPGVIGGALSAILAKDGAAASGIIGYDLGRAVGRPVIDDDDLGGAMGLRQRALDRPSQEASVIVIVDYNTDQSLNCHVVNPNIVASRLARPRA